jgi:para-nitrobenzyl esterase
VASSQREIDPHPAVFSLPSSPFFTQQFSYPAKDIRMIQKIARWSLILTGVLAMPKALFSAPPSAPQVQTQSGIVEGKDDGTVRSFLGIPYAAPPVGNLRWKPPAAAAPWPGVRSASAFGAYCMQGRIYDDMNFRGAGGSEACLFLNIWTPAKSSEEKLPVMVWIYGGGFAAGSTSEGRQDGSNLARRGVVVVSMNYRLGVFGFLVHPELTKESEHHASGNYGLLDQLAALRWVRDNIASFGGDPANVTIFGESAGSFSVSAQMASPLAKGLFQKAIGESGAAFHSQGLSFESRAVREKTDVKTLKQKLGVKSLSALRALPAEKILEAFSPPTSEGFDFKPDIDGYFLPESAPAAFAAGKQNDVPLLAGWNHDEGGVESVLGKEQPSADSVKALAKKEFGSKGKKFLQLYPADTPEHALRSTQDFAGDRFIAFSTWAWMEAQAKTGKQPIYRYRFDLAPPIVPNTGAYHSAEIEYVFGQLDTKPGVTWRPEDREMSELIQKYWTNFARTGDPNGPGLPKWPQYSAAEKWAAMYLDVQSTARPDGLRERYLFLAKQWTK